MKKRKAQNKKTIQSVEELPFDLDMTVRLTEIEALKFGKLDAEIRNAAQGIQIANYRKQELRMEFESKCRKEDESMAELNGLIKKLKPEYEELLEELIKKYNIRDRNHLSIDPDTRIIREVE